MIVLAYLGSQCTQFNVAGWIWWFFTSIYLELCIWSDMISRSDKGISYNFLQILEKVQQRPWQWLDKHSWKKAWSSTWKVKTRRAWKISEMYFTFSATVRADWSFNIQFWWMLWFSPSSQFNLQFSDPPQFLKSNVTGFYFKFISFTVDDTCCKIPLLLAVFCSLFCCFSTIAETLTSENEAYMAFHDSVVDSASLQDHSENHLIWWVHVLLQYFSGEAVVPTVFKWSGILNLCQSKLFFSSDKFWRSKKG
jgi:hypothetical protein